MFASRITTASQSLARSDCAAELADFTTIPPTINNQLSTLQTDNRVLATFTLTWYFSLKLTLIWKMWQVMFNCNFQHELNWLQIWPNTTRIYIRPHLDFAQFN